MTILIVDDNSDDRLLIARGLRKLNGNVNTVAVGGGREAVAYLLGQAGYPARGTYPIPDLILLDLRMPAMSGLELLAWLKAQTRFRHIPVIVLSGSSILEEVTEAYQLGAKLFFIKPVDAHEMQAMCRDILAVTAEPDPVAAEFAHCTADDGVLA